MDKNKIIIAVLVVIVAVIAYFVAFHPAEETSSNNTVEIGEGSWLGENVCVLGTHIGKHCVIGANSVVTKDIPDYSVAVGIPAKVIKRFDLESKSWRRIDDKGQFIS